MYQSYGKRLLDLCVAIIGLVVLSPLLLVIAILIRVVDGKPILFRQQRPGLYSRPFTMLKFRTMIQATDARGNPLADELRLTKLGQFLRSTSLDELPELVNVLTGDMSLVGPRPLLMAYLDRYTDEQLRRHDVQPGLTGWAQVNGRNTIGWEQKFTFDLWYVERASLGLDVKILVLTAWQALRRDGISQPGHATAQEFTGS